MESILYSDGKYIGKIQDMHADKISKEDMERTGFELKIPKEIQLEFEARITPRILLLLYTGKYPIQQLVKDAWRNYGKKKQKAPKRSIELTGNNGKERKNAKFTKGKDNFKNHVAKFTDYGNIKILDFKDPKVLIIGFDFCSRKTSVDCIFLVIWGN